MTIIAVEPVKTTLRLVLEGVESDRVLFHAPHPTSGNDVAGLEETLSLAEQGKEVVAIGWWSELKMADIARFRALMGYPGTAYKLLPEGLDGLRKLLCEPLPEKVADPCAIALGRIAQQSDLLSHLRHDARHIERDDQRREGWTIKAISIFGDRPLADLLQLVSESQSDDRHTPLAGQRFPDIFVDVEGTLVINGRVNQALVERVTERSLQEKRPVTIWTGGELSKHRELLREHGIGWKLASKEWFRRATVATAYDDLSSSELAQDYGVQVEEHCRV